MTVLCPFVTAAGIPRITTMRGQEAITITAARCMGHELHTEDFGNDGGLLDHDRLAPWHPKGDAQKIKYVVEAVKSNAVVVMVVVNVAGLTRQNHRILS